MESQLLSISKIFTERILRIPDYQRGYAWKDKQLKDFWNDLAQLETNKNHYIGVLTLEEVPETIINKWIEDNWIIRSKNYTPYYIVDGQQRLTTAIVLIQAIIELMQPEQMLNYNTSDEIVKKFIYESKDKGISRSYIFGYETDNPSYEFLKTRIFLESSDNSYPIQETIYTRNLEAAKIFFSDNLRNISIQDVEIIYRKVTQNLLFNIYTISEDIDVCVAFETMNNRGKPLSHLELLKNRLIYLSTKFNEDESEKDKLRRTINEVWKSIYHYLGKNKNNPLDDDLFLQNHFIIYYGNSLKEKFNHKNNEANLVRIHRFHPSFHKDYLLEKVFTTRNIQITSTDSLSKNTEIVTIKNVYDYVKSLKDSVEIWFQLLNPTDSNFNDEIKIWLDKLNRLDILQYAPLIMVFFQTQSSDSSKLRFLKSVEKLIFLIRLTGFKSYYYYSSNAEPINFIDLALKLRDKSINIDSIVMIIDQKFESIKNSPEFKSQVIPQFRKKGFYEWSGIKYFLYEYELSLKEASKTFRDKIRWEDYSAEDGRDYLTIEHVYPQRPRLDCWTSKYNSKYTEKERTALRHSLGNLVPLSKPKNSSFSNKCFTEKKRGNDSCVGFAYGSFSENEIAEHSDWTAMEIMKRGLKLLHFMETRWDLDFGTTEEKLFFLNLEFVPRKENISLKELISKDKVKKI